MYIYIYTHTVCMYVCIYHNNGKTYRSFFVNFLCDFHCININNTQYMYMSIIYIT